MSGEAIQVTGEVTREERGGLYRVNVGAPLNREVLAKLAGRLAKAKIRVLPGDVVELEVGIYDTSRGRIVYRGTRERRTG